MFAHNKHPRECVGRAQCVVALETVVWSWQSCVVRECDTKRQRARDERRFRERTTIWVCRMVNGTRWSAMCIMCEEWWAMMMEYLGAQQRKFVTLCIHNGYWIYVIDKFVEDTLWWNSLVCPSASLVKLPAAALDLYNKRKFYILGQWQSSWFELST